MKNEIKKSTKNENHLNIASEKCKNHLSPNNSLGDITTQTKIFAQINPTASLVETSEKIHNPQTP